MVRESPEPPARELLGATWLGGNPGLVGKEESPSHGAGSPEPPGAPVDRNTGSVPGPGRWLSGAKDAEKSAGRCRETARGPSISYMEGPRPIVPDPLKPRPDRHAALAAASPGRVRYGSHPYEASSVSYRRRHATAARRTPHSAGLRASGIVLACAPHRKAPVRASGVPASGLRLNPSFPGSQGRYKGSCLNVR